MEDGGIVRGAVIEGALSVEQTGLFDQFKPIQISSEYELVPIFDTRTSVITFAHNGSYMIRARKDEAKESSPMDYEAARKKLTELVGGRQKRKADELDDDQLGSPKRPSSGPPTISSSPLSPKRRKVLHKIRQVLFARDLSKAFMDEAASLSIQDGSFADQDNAASHHHQPGRPQLQQPVVNRQQEAPLERFQLGSASSSSSALVQQHPLQEFNFEMLDGPGNGDGGGEMLIPDYMASAKSYINDNLFDKQLLDNFDFGLDYELQEQPVKIETLGDLQQLDIPIDHELLKQHVEQGKNIKPVLQDIKNDDTGIINDDDGDMTSATKTTTATANDQKENVEMKQDSNTGGVVQFETRNQFCSDHTGMGKTHWFEKPGYPTKYGDILCCRAHFRFLIYLLTRKMKTIGLRVTRLEAIIHIQCQLGYGCSKASKGYHVIRGLVDRMLNHKPGRGEKQYGVMIGNDESYAMYEKAANEIASKFLKV